MLLVQSLSGDLAPSAGRMALFTTLMLQISAIGTKLERRSLLSDPWVLDGSSARSVPVSPTMGGLEELLRREGWSFHRRLEAAPRTQGRSETLAGWRALVAPDHHNNFDKRLRWDGLSEFSAAWALDPPAHATPRNPAWWPLLVALRQAGRDAAAGRFHQELAQRGGSQPFVHVWRPAAAWALAALRHRCADLQPQLQLVDAAWLDLGESLLERLCLIADQPLWELFNQRRTPGAMLLAHLGTNGDGSGEPVHEVYDAFVAELLEGGYGLLLAGFPVLGRLLAVVTELWLDASEEMLRRISDCRAGLEEHFAIARGAPLAVIQLGLSDPHRGGRAVAILSFGSEPSLRRVVYKPKDMRVDATYQSYLRQLNSASTLPSLRTLSVLPRDGYGFMEWVEHLPCGTDEELNRFYNNAGRMIAVLHVLGCTDCHHENLIASGDQLLLIDTETLLEADQRDLISDDGDDADGQSELQISLQGSVLRSGLLPHWIIVGAGGRRTIDISALGIPPPPPEQLTPGWLGINSDGMMMGRSLQRCELPTSLPVALGSRERLSDYVDSLCEGFAAQLQEALRLKSQLLEGLEAFRGLPRRLVARNTRMYFTIQRQMLEATALRSAVAHGLKLEQLCRSFVLASEKPLNWPMFRAEILQMERLDIPFFEHRIDSEDLSLPEGLAPIPTFMKTSGLCAAQKRLEQLNGEEIVFQQRLIRGAIAARHLQPENGEASGRGFAAAQRPLSAEGHWSPELCCAEAFRIGEELWAAALADRRGRPEWLGMDLGKDGESFRFGLVGPSLYSGVSGIALLFASLALSSAGETAACWRQRAWSTFEGLAELADRNRNDQLFRHVRDQPFGLSGTGGTLLSLHCLQQLGVAEASRLEEQLIDQLRPERLLADEAIDVIGGVSGLIGPLVQSRYARGRELAILCGDRLLNQQLPSGGWPCQSGGASSRPPLTGFSHGAAGMAAALARLFQATGDNRYAEGVARAVAYERSVFDSARGNWPDFRTSSSSDSFMLSWCHGAPGILLSRHVLRAAGLADDDCEIEQAAARASTLASLDEMVRHRGVALAHLCCGVLGLTSLLRIDARASGQPLGPAVVAAESALMACAQADGFYQLFSVDNGSLNLPGLFTGQAGVALALLEAAQGPRWLPAVLSAGCWISP